MHELAITKEIIKIIEEESIRNKIKPKEVHIEIGEITGYKKDPLIYYYNLLRDLSEIIKKSNIKVDVVDGEDLIIRKIAGEEHV